MIRFLIYTILLLLLSGCSAKLSDPDIDFAPPAYVEQLPSKEDQADYALVGSVFGQGDNPLFTDHKAMHINDIVTIVISETAKSTNSGSKQLSKEDNLGLNGGAFAYGGDNSLLQQGATKLNNLGNMGFNAGSTSSYKGQGSANKNAAFNTTISARIVKILENGNYYIHGKREILVDDQKQIMQIAGVIRPYDIDQYNKISSSQISDAKILYKTQGDIDQSTQRGWASKLVNAVWPF